MKIKVCVIQDSPIFFNKKASLDKALDLITEASNRGNRLIVFPESFIPGYPRGFDFGASIGSRTPAGRRLYQEYYDNSIDLEGNEVEILEKVCRDQDVYLVMGITERMKSNGSMYCTMIYISPEKGLMGHHRKIKPTGTERIVWAEGDGSTLSTFDTKIGIMGGLICWENYMPLARMSLYQKGVQLYIAPTADSRSSWTLTMQHIAMEGRCFVIASNQFFTKSMLPDRYHEMVIKEPEEMSAGGSVIVGPDGKILAGPLFGKPGQLEVEIDLDLVIQSRLDFDPSGHYNRPDIFSFMVKNQPPTISD